MDKQRARGKVVLLALLLFAAPLSVGTAPVSAAPADLDLAFGEGGKATADFPGGGGAAAAVAAQPDGKIVVAGTSGGASSEKSNFGLARHHADGTLDDSFGKGGVVATHIRGWDQARAVLLLEDGKIVVGGCADCGTATTDVALTRYLPDGTLDPSFGVGGTATRHFGEDHGATHFGEDQGATDLALQPDGKIVVSVASDDFLIARFNQDGSRDNSFGPFGDGTARADFGGYDVSEAVVVQPDGMIVAAGCADCLNRERDEVPGDADFGVVRFLSTGDADETFGPSGTGRVSSDFLPVFGAFDRAHDVLLQDDGRILVAGESRNGRSAFALLRLLQSGLPDASFGQAGQVTTYFGSGRGTGTEASARAVAVQPDGKIVAAGAVVFSDFDDPPHGGSSDFAFARYTSTGQLDPLFGSDALSEWNGQARAGFKNAAGAEDLALLDDGGILAAGSSALVRLNSAGSLDPVFGWGRGWVTTVFGGGSTDHGNGVVVQQDGRVVVVGATNGGFGLARFTSNGKADNSFDGNGKALVELGRSAEANDVVIQNDEKIVAAGTAQGDFALVRLDSTGALDPAFGIGGRAAASLSDGDDEAHALALLPDGKIVVAGCSRCGTDESDFTVTRFNTDGTLDPTFGTDGSARIDFGGRNDLAEDVAIQPDGRIVVAGTAEGGVGYMDFGVVRLLQNGSLDPTFGTGGKTTVMSPGPDFGRGLFLQPDGKIVVAGEAHVATTNWERDSRFALIRLTSDGTLDATFGTEGRATTDFTRSRDGASAVAVQPGGKIVAVGCADCGKSVAVVAITRYDSDGQPDPTFGNSGAVSTKLGEWGDSASDVVLQDDGKIVVGGVSDHDFLVARYLNTSGVDLSVSMSDSPDPVKVKKTLTYTMRITNNGTAPAPDVSFTDRMPQSTSFLSVSTTQGSCVHASGTVSCSLGKIPAGGAATVTIDVQPQSEGTITNTASVSSSAVDQDSSNNSASATTTVTRTKTNSG